MTEFFDSLTHWHWLGLAAFLLVARALMPFGMAFTIGRSVLAFGLAAAVVGLALRVDSSLMGLQQLGLAVLAVMAVKSVQCGKPWICTSHFREAEPETRAQGKFGRDSAPVLAR